jgi:Na+/proline symporter
VIAFFVDDIASTVIVAVNKVGSLINGPILGVFLLGLMTKTATGRGVRVGFFAGLAVNAFLWAAMPSVSWLWWNVIGLAATMGVGLMMSGQVSSEQNLTDLVWSPAFYQNAGFTKSWVAAYGLLGLWTLLLMGVLAMFGTR